MAENEETEPKKTITPLHIYDFNGSWQNFGHLMNLFLSPVVIICLDADLYRHLITIETGLMENEEKSDNETKLAHELNMKTNKDLFNLLDLILFRISKNFSFYIIPVLTKCDLIENKEELDVLIRNVQKLIKLYIDRKLHEIGSEIKKLESLPKISSSLSDRIKILIQNKSNASSLSIQTLVAVSSIKMQGLEVLTNTIKDIVFNNSNKLFSEVNKKIPSFWLNISDFAVNKISQIPIIKYIDGNIKIVYNTHSSKDQEANGHHNATMSILCVSFLEYRQKIIRKFGMSHLVETVTKYLNSSGKLLWFSDNDKLKNKIFIRPSILYDLFFVLYRSNFIENFTDATVHGLRSKLIQNNTKILNDENLSTLIHNFTKRGNYK